MENVACVPTGECPFGLEWDGALCVEAEACPEGFAWDGRECVRLTGEPEPKISPDPTQDLGTNGPGGAVARLMNGKDAHPYATHWAINERTGMNGHYAFFEDGTGLRNYYGGAGQGTPITWTQLGQSTLLVEPKHIFSSAPPRSRAV